MTDSELDNYICNRREFPPRQNDRAWLEISQALITNVRYLINTGKTETANIVIAHYWKRWRGE